MTNGLAVITDRIRNSAARLRRGVLDFAFPPACPWCGGEPEQDSRTPLVSFCQVCRDDMLVPVPYACEVCGAPVGPFAKTDAGCGECRMQRPAFRRVIRLGMYEGSLRKACIRAKDPLQEPVMAACGKLLVEEQADALMDPEPECVVPIPQHWSRRAVSRHSAAEVLASVIGVMLDIPVSTAVLARSRRTAPQKRAESVSARRANQRGSFAVSKRADVAGRKILLVDDILTTGATALEAARELRSKAAHVTGVAVVARVLSRQIGR